MKDAKCLVHSPIKPTRSFIIPGQLGYISQEIPVKNYDIEKNVSHNIRHMVKSTQDMVDIIAICYVKYPTRALRRNS